MYDQNPTEFIDIRPGKILKQILAPKFPNCGERHTFTDSVESVKIKQESMRKP